MRKTLHYLSRRSRQIVGIGAFSLFMAGTSALADDFDYFMNKIYQDALINPTESSVSSLMSSMKTDGSWANVDYKKTDRTNWEPLNHVDNLTQMVFAYVNEANPLHGNEGLYNKIVLGLQYWYDINPYCSNWWYNQIAEPQRLGVIMIAMRYGQKQLPATLESNTLARMKSDGGNPAAQTGANRTDVATHHIYRALLTKDASLLKTSIGYMFEPLKYVTGEGIQYDHSYFQHGKQFYIGGYGDALLTQVMLWGVFAQGTQFAIDPDRIQILRHLLIDSYAPVMRGSYMMFNTLGRGMSRRGAINKSGASTYFNRMAIIDPAHAEEYKDIADRISGKQPANYKVTPRHIHYFIGDVTQHIRPTYTFNVRTVSTRTLRLEYGNGENLKTYFQSDGSTNIAQTGDEYYQIPAAWNWQRLPGVTTPKMAAIPKASNDWQTPGTSTFTGGVSDSLYGVTCYNYYDTYSSINTKAKKSWFFFDDEVVCLGAGITSPYRTYTTINQCWSKGNVTICSDDNTLSQVTTQNETTYNNNVRWMLHDGVGYVFPNSGRLVMYNKEQSGNWYDINTTENKVVEKGNVFSLAVDHTIPRTIASSYAYIVVPNQTEEGMKAYDQAADIEIMANTDSMQVVRHKKLGIWGLVFYKACTFYSKDLNIRTDKPCALLVKNLDKETVSVHVADPGQTKSVINLGLLIPSLSEKAKALTCDFRNTGYYAGQSKAYGLSASAADYEGLVGIRQTTASSDALKLVCNPAAPHAGTEFNFFVEGTENGRVSFYDTTGNMVGSAPIESSFGHTTLPASGTYIARVVTGSTAQSFKILVK